MRLAQWTFLFMLMSAGVMAQDLKLVGTVDQAIQIPSHSNGLRAGADVVKHIVLLKVELSDRARQKIESRADNALQAASTPVSFSAITGSGTKAQLGMGNVPVLDQGGFGSCVVFANTAAVDAVLNQGDYISQLCQLQLGRYLEKNAYILSGWEGSFGGLVLNQMDVFGLISKAQQVAHGCGGVTEYPSAGFAVAPGSEMSPEEYHQLSEPLNRTLVGWSSVLDSYQVFFDKVNMKETVNQVKVALNAGDRLTFGILLPSIHRGVAGAVGKYHAGYDSWLLTPEIVQEMKSQENFAGHELIITGYDDDAEAIDDHGRKHKGLFTLRNSWGSSIGDKGNFYMSYDYFQTLAVEVQRIRHLAS